MKIHVAHSPRNKACIQFKMMMMMLANSRECNLMNSDLNFSVSFFKYHH